MTFTDAKPTLPSQSADMMVAPVANAVMSPVALTVATEALLLLQELGRPLSKPPDWVTHFRGKSEGATYPERRVGRDEPDARRPERATR